MRSTLRRVVLFLLGSLVGAIPAFGAETARPFRLDDIFELEDVGRYYGGPWAFSPDGQSLAFTRIRAKKTLANHKWEYLWGNSGGDVWLQPAPGEKATVLTDGLSDGSGWWAPQWSPDGKRLAMLSTRGGNVGLWVMEIGGKPRRLTERGVDISAVYRSPFLWIDGSRILCPLLPEGEQPMSMRVELSTPQIAMREWPKVPAGKEVTASVLQSGVPVDLSKRPQGQLLLIDAETGASKVVVEQNTVGFHASPRGDRVAYCRQVGVYTPKADEPLRFAESGTYTIDIRSLDGTPVRLNAPLPGDVLKESLRWSPGGRELAFFAFGEKRSTPPALFRVDVEAGSVTRIDVSPLDAEPAIRLQPQLEWISGDGLLFLAVNREKGGKPSPTDRRDWWLAPREGKRRSTEAMKQVPGELWPQDGRRAFVGVAGDQLWRLQPSEGRIVALTEKPAEGRSTSIAWPVKSNVGQDEYAPPGRTYAAVVLGEREGQTTTYSLLDIVSGRRQPIARPAADAEVMALGPRGSTVFLASGKDGTFAWRTPASGGAPDVLMAANTFLRGVIEGELQPIEYLSLNGQKLKGWILLPIGYEKGRRYPTIAWVYAGYLYSDRKPYLAQAAHGLSLNMQIPASRGFAVLFPSMPMKQEGEVDEPMLRLQEGVQPALDKAVELGVADPERLFVMGQSFGGFSTYGLVTQTSRFKAAVALAGLSDFISLYTQFDARMRYEEFPHENLAMAGLFESAQTAMGSPPWKDLGRYMRNSPIFYVERVETPVMIVQGDLDYVAIQQGEEFFTSLYRQGKRAEFVRYWGEGHVLESPANIRDMWTRIEAWLDEFGDVTRDARGRLDFDGDRVRSRKPKEDKSAAPSKP
jgi:dipeptidyl aminopeptidase/acylaminoacyl peptidase